jgi:hypothetical protein
MQDQIELSGAISSYSSLSSCGLRIERVVFWPLCPLAFTLC